MSDFQKKFDPKPIKSVLQDIVGQKSLKKGVQNVRICNSIGIKDMLLYQGVLAFEYFTNTKADENLIEAMRKGLKAE